ncbi:MAG: hypothetical protein EPN82_12635 [Bacteroidetes bacterium]|nr:MAG: hypothetical protein EPN82_12635 [Bacteroidota bacterium]
MKRTIIISLFLFMLMITSAFSQLQQQQQPPPKLKPTFFVEDLVFVYQTLEAVDISGGEVDAFLEVRNFLQTNIKTIQEAKKQAGDKYQTEIPLPLAQNMLSFLARAKFSGRNAELYKRFVDSLVESSKALQPKGDKNN